MQKLGCAEANLLLLGWFGPRPHQKELNVEL